MLIIIIQSFTRVMLIEVLDIGRDKIWECKHIYWELGTNTKTDRFLLLVSKEIVHFGNFGVRVIEFYYFTVQKKYFHEWRRQA